MPRLTNAAPKYRKHRASGQAVVTLNGKDHYLGMFDTIEAAAAARAEAEIRLHPLSPLAAARL